MDEVALGERDGDLDLCLSTPGMFTTLEQRKDNRVKEEPDTKRRISN